MLKVFNLNHNNIHKTFFICKSLTIIIDEMFPEDKIKEYLNCGKFVYELYSIILHAGNSDCGHYYSYIKSFENSNIESYNILSRFVV